MRGMLFLTVICLLTAGFCSRIHNLNCIDPVFLMVNWYSAIDVPETLMDGCMRMHTNDVRYGVIGSAVYYTYISIYPHIHKHISVIIV